MEVSDEVLLQRARRSLCISTKISIYSLDSERVLRIYSDDSSGVVKKCSHLK